MVFLETNRVSIALHFLKAVFVPRDYDVQERCYLKISLEFSKLNVKSS